MIRQDPSDGTVTCQWSDLTKKGEAYVRKILPMVHEQNKGKDFKIYISAHNVMDRSAWWFKPESYRITVAEVELALLREQLLAEE